MRRPWFLLVLLAACSSPQSSQAPEPASPAPVAAAAPVPDAAAAPTASAPESKASVKPGINDRFLDPNLDVERWTKTFEGESREVYAARREVLEALEIQPGQSVADIGAGTGFYLWEFAEAVGPSGHAFGVDISPRFLERLRQQVSAKKITNATIVAGTARSVELPAASVDLIFICDTYHHFEYPDESLASIHQALRPGGSLVVVDFERVEGKSSSWTLGHVRAGKEVFRGEIEAAGFTFADEIEISGLSDNYMIRFRASK